MLVAEKQKVLFLLPMKTGTTTIVHTLFNRVEGVVKLPEDCTHWHSAVYRSSFQDYCCVLTVRNPVSRMLSLWHQRIKLKQRGESGINGAHVQFWNKVFQGVNRFDDMLSVRDDSELAQVLRHEWSVISQLKILRRSFPDCLIRQEHLRADFNRVLTANFDIPPINRIRYDNMSKPTESDSFEVAAELAYRFWYDDFQFGGYEMPSNVLV